MLQHKTTDQLVTVFENGELLVSYTLDEVSQWIGRVSQPQHRILNIRMRRFASVLQSSLANQSPCHLVYVTCAPRRRSVTREFNRVRSRVIHWFFSLTVVPRLEDFNGHLGDALLVVFGVRVAS